MFPGEHLFLKTAATKEKHRFNLLFPKLKLYVINSFPPVITVLDTRCK